MKNKIKGFTLVELMGVLIIIGILMLIIIPVVGNVIKKQKEDQYYQQIANIELATKNMGSDNLAILPSQEGEYMYVTLGQLKSLGYIDNSIINPITTETFSDCVRVRVSKENGIIVYEYDQESESTTSCDIDSGNIIVSDPIDQYIKKDMITSFLITVNDGSSDEFLKRYSINKNKIKLTGETDTIYQVLEGNGIYKVVLRGGKIDGEVKLKLESGAIMKNGTDDLVGKEGIESSKSVIIDNTVPNIKNVYANSCNNYQRTITIEASDDRSGIAGYGITTSQTPPSSFVNSTFSSWTSDLYSPGTYYAWVKDVAGNVNSSSVEIPTCDNNGPVIVFGTDGSDSWVSEAATTVTVTDDNEIYSIEYGWSDLDSSTSLTGTVTSGELLSSKCGRLSGNDGECYLYVYACDSSGNCTSKTSNAFKVDVTAPTITNVTNASCSNGLTASYSIQDISSGLLERRHIWCDKDLGSEECYSDLPYGGKLSPTTTAKKIYNPEWTNCDEKNEPPESGYGYSFWVKAVDAVGNTSYYDTSLTSGDLKPYSGSSCNTCG